MIRRPWSLISEFFSLRARRAEIESMPADLHGRLRRGWLLARQKGAAGETLWASGHRVEGLRLVQRACELAAEAVVASEPDAVDLPDALRRRGLSEKRVAKVLAGLDTTSAPPPELGAKVEREHDDAFRAACRTRRRLEGLLRRPVTTVRQLRRRVIRRWAGVAFALLAGAAAIAWSLYVPVYDRVEASDHFGHEDTYAAEKVRDGNPETRWLLPDRTTGWIELQVSPPRPIHQVRMLNTCNAPWNDRGTRVYRLEVFDDDDDVVHAEDGDFGRVDCNAEWVVVQVDAPEVSRVRFTVRTYHALGGGLAELVWESR